MAAQESSNPCCMAEKFDNWCHEVDTRVEHEGKIYCLFHGPAECLEKLDKWDNQLAYDRIGLAKEKGTSCDLRGTVFPVDISFSQYNKTNPLPKISFMNATFSGRALFVRTIFSGQADFWGVNFSDGPDFQYAIFSHYATFANATFSDKRKSVFYHTTFSGVVTFMSATFSNAVGFENATFSGRSYFIGSSFSGNASFYRATFSGATTFEAATFNDEAFFGQVTFSDEIVFGAATCKKLLNFKQSIFKKPTIFDFQENLSLAINFEHTRFERHTIFKKSLFRKGSFECCIAVETIIFDDCNMRGLSLAGAPLENFRFISCTWPRSKGRNVIFDSRLTKYREKEGQPVKVTGFFPLGNQDQEEILEKPLPDNEYIEDRFRRLKAVALKEHDDLVASDWHYGEKEMQLRRLQEESSLKNFRWDWGWFGSLFLYIVTWIYKRISGYGEEPLRAFAVLMILGLLPTPLLSYLLPGLPSPFPGGVEHYLPLMKKIPDGNAWWLSFWMVFWQLLITIQAALLGFALRNKLRR